MLSSANVKNRVVVDDIAFGFLPGLLAARADTLRLPGAKNTRLLTAAPFSTENADAKRTSSCLVRAWPCGEGSLAEA